MECPRCRAALPRASGASDVLVCPGCGGRFRNRRAASRDEARPPRKAAPPAEDFDDLLARLGDAPGEAAPAVRSRKATAVATAPIPRAEPVPLVPRGERAVPPSPALLQEILDELRSVRRQQEEILSLVRALQRQGGGATVIDPGDLETLEEDSPPPPPVRSGRKSVLVIDGDTESRQAVVEAMQQAEVPVRACADGGAGLAAVAEQRPDVIVLELALPGPMGGKDVVNVVKATMEWVDIPIVLHTRVPVEGQKEARQVHGADEVIAKAPGSIDALVARVISIFRRT